MIGTAGTLAAAPPKVVHTFRNGSDATVVFLNIHAPSMGFAAASDVLVITPILPGGLKWLVSDTDRARHEADERLRAVLGHMEAMDVQVEGRVGDETPLTAFDDAVDDFRPDHILNALRSSEHAGWQERRLLDKVRERFRLPITVFEIGAKGEVRGSSA